jgi:hypothetical protein
MKHIACTIVAILLLSASSGCSEQEDPQAETAKKVDELAKKVDELKALVAELKQNRPGADERYAAWVNTNLVPGKTTVREVEDLFGRDYFNLDRPERDNVITLQYSVSDIAGKKLVLDFAADAPKERTVVWPQKPPKDAVLANLEFGYFLCGYCPHILVDDGHWRLEGKMLPGATGLERERSDTLTLPRAKAHKGKVRIKLANWAPETEYLDQVELGAVAAAYGQELDVDCRNKLYAWRSVKTITMPSPEVRAGKDQWRIPIDSGRRPSVLVLEVRNTERFQNAMCKAHRDETPEPNASLNVAGGAERVGVAPVGTKFFRRVVIPLTAGAREAQLSGPAGMWWVRRAWLGQGQPAHVAWLAPAECHGPANALAALLSRDGKRLRLLRDEVAELTFVLPAELRAPQRRPLFALRMFGYYEFAASALAATD